jgi:pimeloyl-ACP methyl ester carboxylesterase
MFRDLIPLLAGRHRVIAPDHLGFGLSDAPGPTSSTTRSTP